MASILAIRERAMEYLRIGKGRLFLENGRVTDFYKLYDNSNTDIVN